jgi:RimJ/RimL family protein N-acetyltransferase
LADNICNNILQKIITNSAVKKKDRVSQEDFLLAPLEDSHIKHLIRCAKKPDLVESMGWDTHFESHETEQFIQSISSCALPYCRKESQPIVFGIFLKKEIMPIGYSVLKGMNTDISAAEIGVAVLEKKHGGYGRLALEKTVEYGFFSIDLEIVGATILLSNKISRNMCKRVGFREKEVLPRSWTMPDGKVVDMVWMEITRENFANK